MLPSKLSLENGTIYYTVKDNKVTITEYSGKDLLVVIPEYIDGCSVTNIGKKAFLSSRFVKEIVVPNTIERIDEYAFARCRKLNKITMPYKKMEISQDIFKDCDKLNFICNGYKDSIAHDDITFLLAKTLNELEAFFLFDLENAGKDEWIKHLDATISMRMDKDDMEDFSKMILCGEEEVVCGEDGTIEDSNPEHYKSNRVKEKVRIAFMRLIHNYKIDSDLESILKKFLLEHMKGCKTEETWDVVLNEHGDEQEYYDLLLKIEAINNTNYAEILLDMGSRHTEMKSYLMRVNEDNNDGSAAFSEFDL